MLFRSLGNCFSNVLNLVWVKVEKKANQPPNTYWTNNMSHPQSTTSWNCHKILLNHSHRLFQVCLSSWKPNSSDRVRSPLGAYILSMLGFQACRQRFKTCVFISRDDLRCHFILTLVLHHQQSLYTLSSPGAWRRPALPLPAGVVWGEYCCILWQSPVPAVRSSSAHVSMRRLSPTPTLLTWHPSCEPAEREKCQKAPQTCHNSTRALVHPDASAFIKHVERVLLVFGSCNQNHSTMVLSKCIKSSEFH